MAAIDKFLATRGALLSQRGQAQDQGIRKALAPSQLQQSQNAAFAGSPQAAQQKAQDQRAEMLTAGVVKGVHEAPDEQSKQAIIANSRQVFEQLGPEALAKFDQLASSPPNVRDFEIGAMYDSFVGKLFDAPVAPRDDRTTTQKDIDAAFGQGTPEAKEALRNRVTKAGGPQTVVNVGGDSDFAKPEAGFRNTRNEAGDITGREIIPGSKFDRQLKKTARNEKIASIRVVNKARVTVKELEKLRDNIKGNTGLFAGALSFVPATGQYDYQKQIDTLKSRLAINSMVDLKRESPTGSTGFGALSQKELEVITDQIGNLQQFQSPEQFKENVDKIIASYKKNSQYIELEFETPETDPQARWQQILDVGFSIEDAKTIMRADQMEIPSNAPAGEFEGFSIVQ